MEIAKMSAAQLTKAMEKASTESSKITQMMIDAGRGNEYPSDMMKKSDPLSLKYQKSASLLQDLYAEKNRRITYSGTMRPIKYQENPTMATKKFSPAQIAAQKLFAERARAGTLGRRKKRKPNPGLYENIDAKRERIAAGSGEKMRKPGQAGRPTAKAFEQSAMTAKRNPIGEIEIPLGGNKYGIIRPSGDGYGGQIFTAFYFQKSKTGFKDEIETDLIESKDFKTMNGASKFLASRGRKTNPDKSKPRAYVKRASQATGAPPSKRLLTRRKKALSAPAGYFPNPKAAMMTGYQVIGMLPKKNVVGIFKTMARAKNIATFMADANGVPYGVKTVKVHKAHFAV